LTNPEIKKPPRAGLSEVSTGRNRINAKKKGAPQNPYGFKAY